MVGKAELNPAALADEVAKRNCGVQWSLAVDARLDQLVEHANVCGFRTNRRELLSAIVATASPRDDELGAMLIRYRTMTVAEVVRSETGENVIHITRHGPGPRVAGA